ncbi:SanA/YdcF family protein [Nocardiopsis baichengensis]|uniref:SanA/YdcF family protein n=1 Tax=Nocardiopsis baichengensis TaxID=280240 RepID=UPI000363A291|nr:ElyC/SanA/YdcF family protein [Nocardiopsis baichengensis]
MGRFRGPGPLLGNRRRAWAAAAAALCAVLLPLPFAWFHLSSSGLRSGADEVPERPVALVLGAGLDEDGRPRTMLSRRLDIAAELYHSSKVDAVLVSGDNSREGYNETDAMADYLAAVGVPRDKVAADYAGFSTWDSCARAHRVFGVEAATVVTQEFHLPRALGLCRAAGIDAVGVGDPSGDRKPSDTAYGYVRELPAGYKAAAQALFRPDPVFPGPPETDVEEALAAPR